MEHRETPGSVPALQPLITVSVVSHGHGTDLLRLLHSLETYEQLDQLQIIVTDNLENDLPESVLAGWTSLQVIRNREPRSFAQNHNAACRLATGEYFCIVNPDVIFTGPTLGPLIRDLQSGNANIISPLATNSKGELQDSFRSLPDIPELIKRRWVGRKPPPPFASLQPILSPDWIAGFFLLMPTSVFARLGGFDEGYSLYFEDVDLCTRARLMGLSLAVDTRLYILHEGRRLSRHHTRYLAWHIQSAIRFFTSNAYRTARRRQA